MHLYVITRGVKPHVDNLINDLQAQNFPFKHDGVDKFIQLAVRPIQLWELVMPRDSLQNVMQTLWNGQLHHAEKYKLIKAVARRALGKDVKDVPELDPKATRRLVRNQHVSIYPIGIKEDRDDEYGEYL